MSQPDLVATAHALVGAGRGLLAMDESNGTCNKRFAALDIPQTEEARRAYRELIVTTPGLGECVSGAGVAFLSGGQSAELASARLSAINLLARGSGGPAPWPLVFSFARAIQQPALQAWRGKASEVDSAQQAPLYRAECNHAAIHGSYLPDMETAPALRRAS